ncbi:DUF3299 domain-containing protein [Jannaschia pohangensis]|uniref:DUF3299 domain-containing protein n=1 Tax=Jannaschia pohangensis TaxID=390807 RepID=A0A1I3IVL2_9RHOB|nr:DUF3299 domain-containing protein [Jannaschia pohangensis]SFI51927.1 hypothetical protein SAMN04488095_1113 [Jannaschia pohangensis]
MHTSRRTALLGLASASLLYSPHPALAAPVREITWDDLIPPGVPYSEIVGEGEYDEQNDTWLPKFDQNAFKFAEALNGVTIKMPGYMLPLETGGNGVTEFILTPYVGACIHVPPPPPNQLVFVTSARPWPAESMFEAVWVTGTIRVNPIRTSLAEIGYDMTANAIEVYEWE